MSYTYTTIDVSSPCVTVIVMTHHITTLTWRDFQTDAELSRLIGTLRLDAKVRTFSILCDVRDERDDDVKDSENTNQDLSMVALQTVDLPRGGITSMPECQFHTNVRTHTKPVLAPHHFRSHYRFTWLDRISLARRTLRMSSPPLRPLPHRCLPYHRRRLLKYNLHSQSVALCFS